MKFTKLSTKFNKLLKKKKKGKTIRPEKLLKLQELLNQKKSRFEKRLQTDLSEEKRTSIKSKLNVVSAQLAKTETLLLQQSDKPQEKDQPVESASDEQPAETASDDQPGEPVNNDQPAKLSKDEQPAETLSQS